MGDFNEKSSKDAILHQSRACTTQQTLVLRTVLLIGPYLLITNEGFSSNINIGLMIRVVNSCVRRTHHIPVLTNCPETTTNTGIWHRETCWLTCTCTPAPAHERGMALSCSQTPPVRHLYGEGGVLGWVGQSAPRAAKRPARWVAAWGWHTRRDWRAPGRAPGQSALARRVANLASGDGG